MKRITIIVAMIVLMLGAAKPAGAKNRYIVQSTGGLLSVLNLCSLLGCQVQGSLDGTVGQTFLVTSVGNLVTGTLTLAESLLGIVSIEADRLLPVPQQKLPSIPAGLYDTSPVKYYGTVVWHGYPAPPPAQIILLTHAHTAFSIARQRIVTAIYPC